MMDKSCALDKSLGGSVLHGLQLGVCVGCGSFCNIKC